MYYEQSTHPHPIIRLTNIIFHIVNYCKQVLEKDDSNIKVDTRKIINECIRFSNNISTLKFGSNQIEDYQDIISIAAWKIMEYLKNMQAMQENNKSLATYKWNENARRIGNLE